MLEPLDTDARHCPKCGYNLFGIQSERCPECGDVIIDELTRPSLIPWQHRKRVGWIRAFCKTWWLAMCDPNLLAREVRYPVSSQDASIFSRMCAMLGSLLLSGLIVILLTDQTIGGIAWTALRTASFAVFLFVVAFASLYVFALLPNFYYLSENGSVREARGRALVIYAASAPLVCAPSLIVPFIWANLSNNDAAFLYAIFFTAMTLEFMCVPSIRLLSRVRPWSASTTLRAGFAFAATWFGLLLITLPLLFVAIGIFLGLFN